MLDLCNADEVKGMMEWLPGLHAKPTRKMEVIETIARGLLGGNLPQLWNRLSPLEQSAVAEATHDRDGRFNQNAFQAKYGAIPEFSIKGPHHWKSRPTLVRLFIHPVPWSKPLIPKDLREKLAAFVPAPAEAEMTSLMEIPDQPPRERGRHFYKKEKVSVYKSPQAPLEQRLTEQAAFQDLRAVLRLVDQGKIAVSASTLHPSKAAMNLLEDLLRDHDFFEPEEKVSTWDPEVGPIKAFSWPLLVQVAKLASLKNGKLSLTKTGRAALEAPPAEILRVIWNAWLENALFDEFNRIDTIKGQKGKGGRHFTPPPERRLSIKGALAKCPAGRWVEIAEFSRFMQAAGFQFLVTRDTQSLYLCDPQYGSLGYDGSGGWAILQERYILCLLFEYAAPLGLIDIAYEHPASARDDYKSNWGADDLIFLSRYDGLKYFRLTSLGTFILGLTTAYEPPQARPGAALSVLPARRIRLDEGSLLPDEVLLLESYADRDNDRLWSLNEVKAIQAVERGARVAEFRAFLGACDSQPLPEAVDAFLRTVEERGTACVVKSPCLLVECLTPQIAEVIAHDPKAGALCQRVGDRGLVVATSKEDAFRGAVNGLGFGMPRV